MWHGNYVNNNKNEHSEHLIMAEVYIVTNIANERGSDLMQGYCRKGIECHHTHCLQL